MKKYLKKIMPIYLFILSIINYIYEIKLKNFIIIKLCQKP